MTDSVRDIINIKGQRRSTLQDLHDMNWITSQQIVLACVQEFFMFTMCWFETILSSQCAR